MSETKTTFATPPPIGYCYGRLVLFCCVMQQIKTFYIFDEPGYLFLFFIYLNSFMQKLPQ